MPTILLVDNDPLQAWMCKSILERRFRDVQRVVDAAEALCLVEQTQFVSELGLVVSDLSMPGLGNTALVAELQDRLPGLPILVIGSVGETRGYYGKTWVKFLARPFSGDQLLAAADELMAQRALPAA